MRCYNREKMIFHGNYLDVQIYPVFTDSKPKGTRRKKAKPTSEIQQLLNEKNSKRHNIYLINENFTKNDLVVHLTYDDISLPDSSEQAERDSKNFIRRIRRALKNKGIELKYFAVYEQAPNGRHHHHIIISGGLTYEELVKMWQYGIAEFSALFFDEYGVTGLTQYITKETKGKKKISHSRNLKQPKERQRDGKLSQKQLRELHNHNCDIKEVCRKLYPGYELADMEPFYNDVNGNYYITFRLYKPEIFKKRRRRNDNPTGQPAA